MTSQNEKLEEILKSKLDTRILSRIDANCYETDHGRIFLKENNSTFGPQVVLGEFESIKAIKKTDTVRVPNPITTVYKYDEKDSNKSGLVVEYLDLKPLDNQCARNLGASLADLHEYNRKVKQYRERGRCWIGGNPPAGKEILRHRGEIQSDDEADDDKSRQNDEIVSQLAKHSLKTDSEPVKSSECNSDYAERFVPPADVDYIDEFGFHVSTCCGRIPQINEWTDDWVSFFARYRLDEPIRTILSDYGDRKLMEDWSLLQLKVDRLFVDCYPKKRDGEKIVPALLHGDLWSGNRGAILYEDDGLIPVVYDPSSFFGHYEYEFAISRMFRASDSKLIESAYFEQIQRPKPKLFESRSLLYQLFHHLNHWNHFGGVYATTSMNILSQLNKLT